MLRISQVPFQIWRLISLSSAGVISLAMWSYPILGTEFCFQLDLNHSVLPLSWASCWGESLPAQRGRESNQLTFPPTNILHWFCGSFLSIGHSIPWSRLWFSICFGSISSWWTSSKPCIGQMLCPFCWSPQVSRWVLLSAEGTTTSWLWRNSDRCQFYVIPSLPWLSLWRVLHLNGSNSSLWSPSFGP